MDKTEELLTKKQVAALLGVSEMTVHRRLAAGVIPSLKLGRSRRIRRRDLETYLARQGLADRPAHRLTYGDVITAREAGPRELDRVSLQHVFGFAQRQGIGSWALMRAAKPLDSAAQNADAFSMLEARLEALGLGHPRLLMWHDEEGDGERVERCTVAFDISLKQAGELVAEFDQPLMIYLGPETDGELLISGADAEGAQSNLGPFAPEALSDQLSGALGHPVRFEYPAQSWMQVLMERKGA